MLSLMCAIYKGENYIPRNRPDVYEKCAVMLFEAWDRSRGINPQLAFDHHIKAAMRSLALWLYSGKSRKGGVTERELVNYTQRYLLEKRFEDEDEARAAAENFIDFCSGRAWVLTDVGTTAEGERLFAFTHRTFLEYFAASQLTSFAQ
jgi:predicted NACHT family NTPase